MPLPPMPGAPGGAPPPPGPTGTGPASAPGPMAGNMQEGISAVKAGLEALQKALPMLPMGSELHTAVAKTIVDIGKHVEKAGMGGDQSAMIQQLMEMARSAKTNPAAQAALPQGGGAPPPMPGMEGGEPPMPPMMGA